MSQTYQSSMSGTVLNVAKTVLPANDEALRSMFSGSSAPSSPTPVAGQMWYDTTNGLMKQYDGAAWQVLGPSNALFARHLAFDRYSGTASSVNIPIFAAESACVITKLLLLTDTTTASSDASNEWQFKLTNYTQTLELFSATVGTFTTLGGVGGGEITLKVPYVLTPDQNTGLAANDVLDVYFTKVGSPTSPLASIHAYLYGYYKGS